MREAVKRLVYRVNLSCIFQVILGGVKRGASPADWHSAPGAQNRQLSVRCMGAPGTEACEKVAACSPHAL